MIFNTQQIPNFHRVGLLKVVEVGMAKHARTDKKISSNVIDSKQAYENIMGHIGFPLMSTMDEGAGVTYTTLQPISQKSITPIIRTLGFKRTKQAKDKDLYNIIRKVGPLMAKSYVMTKNLMMANVLNRAFNTAYTGHDAKPLCATDHPLKMSASTASNRGISGTDANISGLNLEDTYEEYLAQVNEYGYPIIQGDEKVKLVCGASNIGLARRSVHSTGLQGTQNNDKNVVGDAISEIVRESWLGYDASGLADAWFFITSDDSVNPIFSLVVQGLQSDSDKDVDYLSEKMVVWEESTCDFYDWRYVHGHNP